MSLEKRQDECPFAVRVFTRTGSHNDERDFAYRRAPSEGECLVYAWKDTTLRELIINYLSITKDTEALHTARFSVKHLMFNSNRGDYRFKELGVINSRDVLKSASEVKGLAAKTLDDIRFSSDDMFDLCLTSGQGSFGRSRDSGPSRNNNGFSIKGAGRGGRGGDGGWGHRHDDDAGRRNSNRSSIGKRNRDWSRSPSPRGGNRRGRNQSWSRSPSPRPRGGRSSPSNTKDDW